MRIYLELVYTIAPNTKAAPDSYGLNRDQE
jgi:hypothetical protein